MTGHRPDATDFRNSNIQKHSRLPAALRSLDREIVKRHRFHVCSLMMPFRIERFALGCCLHKIIFVFLGYLHLSDAQQQTLGVFEKNQLLQEIEQQQVNVVVREFDLQRLTRLDSVQLSIITFIVASAAAHEQFRQIAPGRFKGDIGGAEFFEIFVRHVSNCHPERSAAKSKDPAELLNVTHRGSSTSLGMTYG